MGFKCTRPNVHEQEPFESWHHTVQSAIINTRGVFAIRDFSGDLTWETGSNLSKKVLEAYMWATMNNPWVLHPGLDFHNGEGESESRLHDSSTIAMGSHVDKGLFKIVQATGFPLGDLLIDMGDGNFVNAWILTEYPHLQLLLVIPGYSLQAFEPKLVAPAHQIQHHGATLTGTKIFQCRLAPDFEIQGQRIDVVLADNRWDKQELRLVVDTSSIKIPGLGKKKCAVSGNRPIVEATAEMCVGDLKVLLQDNEYMDLDQHCLYFGGRILEDEMLLGTDMDGRTIVVTDNRIRESK